MSQTEVLTYLQKHPGEHAPKEISKGIGSNVATVRYSLRYLETKGDVIRAWRKMPKRPRVCFWRLNESN